MAAVLHVLYNGLVVGGLVVVVALLRPALLQGSAPPRTRLDRRIDALRAAAEAGVLGREPLREESGPLRNHPSVSAEYAVLVVGSVAAASIHAAMIPAHRQALWVVPTFFGLVALAQLGWALLMVRGRTTPGWLEAGISLHAGVLMVWLVSRTLGLPESLGGRGPVGMWDLVAAAWEIGVVIAAVRLRRRGASDRDRVAATWSVSARACCATAPVLLVVLTVSGRTG